MELKLHKVGDIPPRFEDEFPEEAEIMYDLCAERAEAKAKGEKIKPIYTDYAGDTLYAEPIRVETKIGRNEPCPCGSGKKFKKCCN